MLDSPNRLPSAASREPGWLTVSPSGRVERRIDANLHTILMQ